MSASADFTAASVPSLLGRLVHDVGKYVARTARNVGPDEWTPALAAMLARDLFDLRGGRASRVFAVIVDSMEPSERYPELVQVRSWLAEIDAMEAAIRSGQLEACAQAAALALAVESSLRALMSNREKGSP